MSDRAWWGASMLVMLVLVGAIAVIWTRAVSDYAPHPGQLTTQTAVEEFLSRRPAGLGRVLIPTGIFVQSLHFVTASDVNITGYVWQKYSNSVPEEVTRGFTLPEQVSSGDTVIEEA